jgi:DNA gyrase subunit B
MSKSGAMALPGTMDYSKGEPISELRKLGAVQTPRHAGFTSSPTRPSSPSPNITSTRSPTVSVSSPSSTRASRLPSPTNAQLDAKGEPKSADLQVHWRYRGVHQATQQGQAGPPRKADLHGERKQGTLVMEIALQYNDAYSETVFSFANNINTRRRRHASDPASSTALTRTINVAGTAAWPGSRMSRKTSHGDDVREGLVAVVSVKLPQPQFEGQTKGKLGNSDMAGHRHSGLRQRAPRCIHFEQNPQIAKPRSSTRRFDAAARPRSRPQGPRPHPPQGCARRRRPSRQTGRLLRASEPERHCELYLVEGDSAGGTAKQGRDRKFQAILPLKGKILNVEKARYDKMLGHEEIRAMITALGCGIGKDDFDIAKLRYGKLILMTDADVDGSHIRTLLLTFFFRHMQSSFCAATSSSPSPRSIASRRASSSSTSRTSASTCRSWSSAPPTA